MTHADVENLVRNGKWIFPGSNHSRFEKLANPFREAWSWVLAFFGYFTTLIFGAAFRAFDRLLGFALVGIVLLILAAIVKWAFLMVVR